MIASEQVDIQSTEFAGFDDEALRRSRRRCRQITRSHYENFLVGTILLPKALRQPFDAIYAFCRTADDLADESPTPEQAIDGLDNYQDQIDRLYRGDSVDGIFVSLSETVNRFALPKQPFDDLLSAFQQDQSKNRYANERELICYCQRSANPVGRLVLSLSGDANESNLQLSDQICTGLQLANFWQDVKRDFEKDRIYLPESVMSDFGFDESLIGSTIQNRKTTPAVIRDAVAQQCRGARQFFETGRALVGHVQSWLANDVEMFVAGGLATLDAIERIEFDVLSRRPTVSRLRQARMLGKLVLRRFFA